MKPAVRNMAFGVLLASAGSFALAAGAGETTNAAQEWQLDKFSLRAQYERERREAEAAYAEAVKNCKSLPVQEKNACMKDAKTQLQESLNYAKQNFEQERQQGDSN